MRGHLGAVLTSGISAVALALALLQLAVLSRSAPRYAAATAVRAGVSNRYSVPGGRSGIPYLPLEKLQKAQPAEPGSREGRTPARQQEEHHSPPPSRFHLPQQPGPQPARKLTA